MVVLAVAALAAGAEVGAEMDGGRKEEIPISLMGVLTASRQQLLC